MDESSDYFTTRLDGWALAFRALVGMAARAHNGGDPEPLQRLLAACVPCVQLVTECTPPGPITMRGAEEVVDGSGPAN